MLLSVLYIIEITAEGITGALAAGREKMDIFGVIIGNLLMVFVQMVQGMF